MRGQSFLVAEKYMIFGIRKFFEISQSRLSNRIKSRIFLTANKVPCTGNRVLEGFERIGRVPIVALVQLQTFVTLSQIETRPETKTFKILTKG